MKLVTYLKDDRDQLALCIEGFLYDMDALHPDLPSSMTLFLNDWADYFPLAQLAEQQIKIGGKGSADATAWPENKLLAPIPFPTSYRDAYAFRQHVATSRRNRQLPMLAEFDQFPIFYFGNHNSIQGPGELRCMPDHLAQLDFELEVAIVICKSGKNIKAAAADEHIGGMMILNDFSARQMQMEEMLFNLGPAKGKDFATATGPMLVTLDELAAFEMSCKPNHIGKNWHLNMQCWVNDMLVSEGNLSSMDWTFAEIIERCSYGVNVLPGDIIGSGTVGTGCFLELNGTGKLNDTNYKEQWLQAGDKVQLKIDALGTLHNTIVKEESDWSILKLKK